MCLREQSRFSVLPRAQHRALGFPRRLQAWERTQSRILLLLAPPLPYLRLHHRSGFRAAPLGRWLLGRRAPQLPATTLIRRRLADAIALAEDKTQLACSGGR